MSDKIITQITIDTENYPIGAEAKNVVIGDSNVENEINNLKREATSKNSGLMSGEDKAKLDAVKLDAEANVQADWLQKDSTLDSYIKNKPPVNKVYLKQNGAIKGSFDAINQSTPLTITLDAGGSGGGGGIASTDAVIDNSLTVNGYVIEGENHARTITTTREEKVNKFIPITFSRNLSNAYVVSSIIDQHSVLGTSYNCKTEIVTSCDAFNIPAEYRSPMNYYQGYISQFSLDSAGSTVGNGGTGTPFSGIFYITGNDSLTAYHNSYSPMVTGSTYFSFSLDGKYDAVTEVIESQEEQKLNFPNIHIQGKYADLNDESVKYAHVVGGGTSEENRKNIHTLDWDGNVYFAGDIDFGINEPLEQEVSIFVSGGWTDTDTTIAGVNYKHMCYYPVPPTAPSPQLAKEKYYEGYFTLHNGDIYPMIVYYEGQDNGTITVFTNSAAPFNYITNFKVVSIVNKITSLLGVIKDLQSRIAALEAK